MNKSQNETSEFDSKNSSTITDTDSNQDINEKYIPYNISQNINNISKFFPMPQDLKKKRGNSFRSIHK